MVGGSEEYSGAPFFTAVSTLRAGGDLCTVVTHELAAQVIKSMCAELVVHPGFDALLARGVVGLTRAHAVVLGPGLGRSDRAVRVVTAVLADDALADRAVVLDADGLFVLATCTAVREGVRARRRRVPIIATPNAAELARLLSAVGVPDAAALAAWFDGNLVVVIKGAVDHVVDRTHALRVRVQGSAKRVGGQGDILAGLIALFVTWALRVTGDDVPETVVRAAAAACFVMRISACRAFERFGRGLLTSDIVSMLPDVMRDVEDDCL